MKKILVALVLLVSNVYAGPESTDFSPIYISSEGTNQKVAQPKLIQLNYPGQGKVNCITDVAVSAQGFGAAGWTFYILDGGATSYAVHTTTGAIIEDWYPKNPLCLSGNTTTYVYVSTGNFKLNVSAYERAQ